MGFDQIRGHRKNVELLSRVIQTKRIAHAYIFSGLEGIGKRQVAMLFVKHLLCSCGQKESCGHCSACIQVDQGNHPDLIVIEPAKGVIPIGSIRSLKSELSRKSFIGGYKICIIDGAEQMTVQAENALLKTLEEPTPDTVIILVSEKPYRLLPTILSRCQHVKFQPLSPSDAAELIMEKAGVGKEDALLLATLTGGSPGKALRLSAEYVKELRDSWISQCTNPSKVEGGSLLNFGKDVLSDKESLDLKLNLLRLWYRDLIVHKIYGNAVSLMNTDKTGEIASQSRVLSLATFLRNLLMIEEYSDSLERNVNPQLTLEALFIQLNAPGEQLFFVEDEF